MLADAANDPRHVAVDLLAQAEHDEAAQAILITDDAGFADRGRRGGGGRARPPCRARAIAGASWRRTAPSSWCATGTEAVALINRLAPEHLQLMLPDPRALFGRDPPCRRRLPRPLLPGGGRRLRRRPEPRAADRAHRALRLGPFGLRLPQAHHLGRGDRGRPCRRSAPPPSRWPRPRGCRRMPGASRCVCLALAWSASLTRRGPALMFRPESNLARRVRVSARRARHGRADAACKEPRCRKKI